MTIKPRPYIYFSFKTCRWLVVSTATTDYFFSGPTGVYVNADKTVVTVRSASKTVRIPASDIIGATSANADGRVKSEWLTA